MRSNPIPLISAFLLLSFQAFSQNDSVYHLFLKTGSFIPKRNIDSIFTQEFNRRAARVEGQSLAIIQFEHIPTADEQQQLLKSGLTLIDYIPSNAYTVSIKGLVNEKILHQVKARAIIELTPDQKMSLPLSAGIAPSWSVKVPGTADVWVSFLKIISYETVIEEFRQRKFDIISTLYKNYHIIGLRVPLQRLNELAALPFIDYVQPAPHEDQPLNNVDRTNARANILSASATVGGRNLKGEGIVIGIGDDSDPQLHVDFTNRLVNRTYAPWKIKA